MSGLQRIPPITYHCEKLIEIPFFNEFIGNCIHQLIAVDNKLKQKIGQKKKRMIKTTWAKENEKEERVKTNSF